MILLLQWTVTLYTERSRCAARVNGVFVQRVTPRGAVDCAGCVLTDDQLIQVLLLSVKHSYVYFDTIVRNCCSSCR